MMCTLCQCMLDSTFKSGFWRSFEEASWIWSWSGLVWGGKDLVTICRPTQRISLSRQIIIIIVILIIIIIIIIIIITVCQT